MWRWGEEGTGQQRQKKKLNERKYSYFYSSFIRFLGIPPAFQHSLQLRCCCSLDTSCTRLLRTLDNQVRAKRKKILKRFWFYAFVSSENKETPARQRWRLFKFSSSLSFKSLSFFLLSYRRSISSLNLRLPLPTRHDTLENSSFPALIVIEFDGWQH